MPNSLRSKLSKLRYKCEITDEEYKELISKLDGHDKVVYNQALDDFIEQAKIGRNKFDKVGFTNWGIQEGYKYSIEIAKGLKKGE